MLASQWRQTQFKPAKLVPTVLCLTLAGLAAVLLIDSLAAQNNRELKQKGPQKEKCKAIQLPNPEQPKEQPPLVTDFKGQKQADQKQKKGKVVRFLGAKGKGSRVLIVADCSGSMKRRMSAWNPLTRKKVSTFQGSRFDVLRAELKKTLLNLKNGALFYVVLYRNKAVSLPGPTAWRRGGTNDVRETLKQIDDIRITGSTQPSHAFKATLTELKPPPDIIFFMTDGTFLSSETKKIIELHRRSQQAYNKPQPIHTIQFGSSLNPFRPTTAARLAQRHEQLAAIARQCGGRFNVYYLYLNQP